MTSPRFLPPGEKLKRLQTGLSPLHNAVLLDLGSSAQKLAFRGANVNAVDKVHNVFFNLETIVSVGIRGGYLVEDSPAELRGYLMMFITYEVY